MRDRRWKQLANRRDSPDHPSLSVENESETSINSSFMSPKTAIPVYTVSETLVLGPGETLGRAYGSWEDVENYFVHCRKEPKTLDYYFRDFSWVYGGPDGNLGREAYDKRALDLKFSIAARTRYPCAPLQHGLNYTSSQIDDALKAAFHFENGLEWRWPEPHKRDHRPGVGMWGFP